MNITFFGLSWQPASTAIDRLNALPAAPQASSPKKLAYSQADSASAVSVSAFAASDLFNAANAFVQAEHMEPFTGYNRGTVSVSGYISVERYNNYLFDKAASTMVNDGQKVGLSLNKDDIVSALKVANSSIAGIKDNNDDRVKKLGPGSTLSELGLSDLRNMTDLYIKAKEKGLGTVQVEVLASDQGMANRDKRLGIRTVVYDPEKEKTGYGNTPASEKVSSTSNDAFDKLKTSLYGSLGLTSAVVNLLVDSVQAGNADSKKTLDFIKSLVG